MNAVELLTFGDFVDANEMHGGAAVYALVHRGEVVYIGASGQIFERLRHYRDGHIEHDEVFVCFCDPDKLGKTERLLIRKFKPKHNIRSNPASLPYIGTVRAEKIANARYLLGLGRRVASVARIVGLPETAVWEIKNYNQWHWVKPKPPKAQRVNCGEKIRRRI